MCNKLQALSLFIFSVMPFTTFSVEMNGHFSWSGIVPITPQVIVTEIACNTPNVVNISFGLNDISTQLAYTLSVSNRMSENNIMQQDITAGELSKAENLPRHLLTATVRDNLQFFDFHHMSSEHNEKNVQVVILVSTAF